MGISVVDMARVPTEMFRPELPLRRKEMVWRDLVDPKLDGKLVVASLRKRGTQCSPLRENRIHFVMKLDVEGEAGEVRAVTDTHGNTANRATADIILQERAHRNGSRVLAQDRGAEAHRQGKFCALLRGPEAGARYVAYAHARKAGVHGVVHDHGREAEVGVKVEAEVGVAARAGTIAPDLGRAPEAGVQVRGSDAVWMAPLHLRTPLGGRGVTLEVSVIAPTVALIEMAHPGLLDLDHPESVAGARGGVEARTLVVLVVQAAAEVAGEMVEDYDMVVLIL